MTMRQRRKQFWWTWKWVRHQYAYDQLDCSFTTPDWGVGRIRHQHEDTTK